MATRTETVLSPGEVPRATSRGLGSVPPLAPVVLEGRVIGGMRGGDQPMADDLGPGKLPEGPMSLFILKHPAVLSTTDVAPILLGPPPAGFSRVTPLHVAPGACIHEAIQGREHFLGHPDTEIVAPALITASATLPMAVGWPQGAWGAATPSAASTACRGRAGRSGGGEGEPLVTGRRWITLPPAALAHVIRKQRTSRPVVR